MSVKEGMPITALALIVIGVMCFIFRTGMLSVLITVIGAVLIATGLYDIFVRKNTFLGIAEAVAGAIAVIFGWTLVGAALVIIGIVFVLYGIYLIFAAINSGVMKSGSAAAKIVVVSKPVVMVALGILLVTSYKAMADAMMIAVGVLAVTGGVLSLIK